MKKHPSYCDTLAEKITFTIGKNIFSLLTTNDLQRVHLRHCIKKIEKTKREEELLTVRAPSPIPVPSGIQFLKFSLIFPDLKHSLLYLAQENVSALKVKNFLAAKEINL